MRRVNLGCVGGHLDWDNDYDNGNGKDDTTCKYNRTIFKIIQIRTKSPGLAGEEMQYARKVKGVALVVDKGVMNAYK